MDLMLGVPTGKIEKTVRTIDWVTGKQSPTRWHPILHSSQAPSQVKEGFQCGIPKAGKPAAFALESTESGRGKVLDSAGVVRHRGAAVSHVEVDDILCISPLHRNSKRLKGVKGEGNETAHCVVDRAAQQAGLDLKLQQARVPGIEPKQRKTRCCYHCHLEVWTAGDADTH